MASQVIDAARFDALRSYESLSIDDVKVTRLPESRIGAGFRIDFMGTVDDEYCSLHVTFVPDALAVLEAIELPVTFTTPDSVLAMMRRHNATARGCYALRDERGDDDFEAQGDVYLARSRALIAEWES